MVAASDSNRCGGGLRNADVNVSNGVGSGRPGRPMAAQFLESELPETGEICAKRTTFWNSNRPLARANPRNWHRPVTPGVAGSSPVHSANNAFDDKDLAAFGRLFRIPKF